MRSVEQRTSSDGVRVFRAIDRGQIMAELHVWAHEQRMAAPSLCKVGLFGSYAKDTYTPGSDLDLLLLVRTSAEHRWFMRSAAFDTSGLSVGADLFVYTEAEAERMERASAWFRHVLREVIWID